MDTPSPGMQNTDSATASTASEPSPTSPTADEERTGEIVLTYVFRRPVKAQEDGGPWVQELVNFFDGGGDAISPFTDWLPQLTTVVVKDDRGMEVQRFDYAAIEGQPDGAQD